MRYTFRGYTIQEQPSADNSGTPTYQVLRPNGMELGVFHSRQRAHLNIFLDMDEDTTGFEPAFENRTLRTSR